MDLGIGNAIAALWIAYNFWSLVPVAIVFAVGIVIWKVAITPKEYQERLAWNQARENKKLSTPMVRRMGTTALIWMFGVMASLLFCFSFYMALK